MKQRNWRCDISPLIEELGYKPEYKLERGVKEIISWYKKKDGYKLKIVGEGREW